MFVPQKHGMELAATIAVSLLSYHAANPRLKEWSYSAASEARHGSQNEKRPNRKGTKED